MEDADIQITILPRVVPETTGANIRSIAIVGSSGWVVESFAAEWLKAWLRLDVRAHLPEALSGEVADEIVTEDREASHFTHHSMISGKGNTADTTLRQMWDLPTIAERKTVTE